MTANKAERGRQESARRRRAQIAGAIPVALGSTVIAIIHVGVVGGLLVAVVTPAAVIGLIWGLLRHDQRRRVTRLAPGVLAMAAASVRAHQLRRFDPNLKLSAGPALLFLGEVEVRADTLTWRPAKRFRRRGASDIVVPWSEVTEMNCLPLGGLFRCDACVLSLGDGRELLINVTGPAGVETAVAALGIPVTGDPVQAAR